MLKVNVELSGFTKNLPVKFNLVYIDTKKNIAKQLKIEKIKRLN